MRAHTASGTGPELAFAPEPTAAWFAGNRVFGSAPASGTGASVVFAGGVVWVGDGVLVAVDLVAADSAAVGVGVLTSFETGEPALQPARARARQVRMLAHVAPLAVPLRRIVRSVSVGYGRPESATGAMPRRIVATE